MVRSGELEEQDVYLRYVIHWRKIVPLTCGANHDMLDTYLCVPIIVLFTIWIGARSKTRTLQDQSSRPHILVR